MDQYVTDGAIDWLLDPEAARAAAPLDERSELDRAVRALQDELDALEAERAELASLLDGTGASAGEREPGTRDGAAEVAGTEPASPPAVGPPSLEERLAESPEPAGAAEASRAIPGILIGSELSASLHVEIGDQVQIINPDGDDGPTGPIPRAWPYRVVGVFHTGLYEFDSSMVYMHLPEARRFLEVDAGEVTGLEVRLSEMDAAREQGGRLEAAIAAAGRDDVEVATWMQLNERLFSALMLEQLVIGLLLMIIVLVASFAIVCVLIMIVIQRGDEIAILRAMGASSKGIRRVFVIQGMCIGVAGTLGGLALGLGLVGYLVWVGFPLEPSVYYIDRVPVELSWREVIAVATGALGISAVATLLPSMQAARLDPAAALRHD
jgi:lipoprotein-releasing system permease protein